MALVYWIRKKEHTDIFSEGYVGVTSRTLEDRIADHIKTSKESHDKVYAVHKAIKSIGIDNLVYSVVIIGEEDYCYEFEKKLRPERCIGWNIAQGGDKPPSKLGFKHSDESKEKISAIWKGKKRSKESVQKSADSRRGFKMPREVVDRIAEKNRGRKQSQESIDKRVEKVKGQKRTEVQKRTMSDSRLSKNPWEIKPAKIETWEKADIYFEIWKEEKSPFKAGRKLGLSHKALVAMFKWFERGYVPLKNENWLKTFRGETIDALD